MVDLELPPSLEDTHVIRRRGRVGLLLHRDWAAALPVDRMLAGAPLETWGEPVQHVLRGRARVHVLRCAAGELVAKRMTRGGVVGAVLRTRYLDPRRPLLEADLAVRLAQRGCVTPPVVVARITRGRLGLYGLEVGTERILGGRDLLDSLRHAEAPAQLAGAVGRTLRTLHDAGLRHRDLQVKNLLVLPDRDELAVLDLDRCKLDGPLDAPERAAALARLGRSLLKHGLLASGKEADPARLTVGILRTFLAAYGPGGCTSRAVLLRAVVRRVRRTLWARRCLWRRPVG